MARKVASRRRSRARRSMAQPKWSKPGSTAMRAAVVMEEPHAFVQGPHLADPVNGRACPRRHGAGELRRAVRGRRDEELVVLTAAQRPAQGVDVRRRRPPRGSPRSPGGRRRRSARPPGSRSRCARDPSRGRPRRSIIAVAQPEPWMSRLSATRGVGIRCGRTTASTTAGGNRPCPRSSTARPAAEAPRVPVTRMASPGRAPLRRRGAPVTRPTRVTERTTPPGRGAGVAPDERHAVLPGHVQESRVQLVGFGHGEARREREGQQCKPGLPAHGGDVGDVDRHRLGADLAERRRGPAEVDALEQGVRRQQERPPAPAHRGGVIPDSDQDVGHRTAGAGGGAGQ